jgi:hypothetical protein
VPSRGPFERPFQRPYRRTAVSRAVSMSSRSRPRRAILPFRCRLFFRLSRHLDGPPRGPTDSKTVSSDRLESHFGRRVLARARRALVEAERRALVEKMTWLDGRDSPGLPESGLPKQLFFVAVPPSSMQSHLASGESGGT